MFWTLILGTIAPAMSPDGPARPADPEAVADGEEAARWSRKAAQQGDAFSQYRLGNAFEWGIGVAKSARDALFWYRKAASSGDEDVRKAVERLESQGSELNQ